MKDNKRSIPKPIVKWLGGKSQIIDKLIADFPLEINNYHEPFLGGGSVLLALLSYVKSGAIKIHGNIYACDLNESLIYMYKNIQTQHNSLYDTLKTLIADYKECERETKEAYYYLIRSRYNNLSLEDKKGILGSAMFIFLNKTGFRGMFRVGPNGFNVPYGHYSNPEIINKEHLDIVHNLIQGVIFECCDFTVSLMRPIVASSGSGDHSDFLYIDPPYAPETTTSFVGYTEKGFNIENHNKLFGLIHDLTDANHKVMLSNADVSLVRSNFTKDLYHTTPILCKRYINSKNPDAKAKEVIIRNY